MTKKTDAQPMGENKQQLAAFRKAAKELGADESEDQFKETLRTLAKAKPQLQAKKNALSGRFGNPNLFSSRQYRIGKHKTDVWALHPSATQF